MSYANLLLPHPIIRPGGFDYNDNCDFGMIIDKATCTEDRIHLELSYELQSISIGNMIKENKAKIFVMIKCTKTNQRIVFNSTKTDMILDLQLADYVSKLNIIPYIVTSEEIHNFKSEEHVDEIQSLMPDGVDLPIGAILAIGKQHEITVDSIEKIQAAINIVGKDSIEEGEYYIDTAGEHIQIVMHPITRDAVKHLHRRSKEVLYASLYVTAIEHAIRDLSDDNETLWAQALRKTLGKQGIEINDDLKDNANKHAQAILIDSKSNLKPLGLLVQWYDKQTEGQNDEFD